MYEINKVCSVSHSYCNDKFCEEYNRCKWLVPFNNSMVEYEAHTEHSTKIDDEQEDMWDCHVHEKADARRKGED